MNIKLWSVVAILIIVLAGTGIVLSDQVKDKDRVAIVAMVNEEGSGLFASNSVPGLTLNPETTASWDGLVIATPGESSIQHMILMDFVTNVLEMNFILYGSDTRNNSVYYTAVAPSQMGDTMLDGRIQGGIAWEAHYSNVIDQGKYNAYSIGTTDDLWDNHPCCVIAASRAFLADEPNGMLRFLSAYSKSVLWVNDAIKTNSPNHSKLVEYVKKNAGVDNEVVIQDALDNVLYTYSLDNLKGGLERMVNTYNDLGLINKYVTDMGFNSTGEFADWLVDGSFLRNAVGREPSDYSQLTDRIHIDVAVLAYDIHQIALHVGIGEGIFSEYGLDINTGTPFAAGGDVMNALLSGQVQLGFVGSPPVVLNTINFW